jgi:hypothetical protein
MEGPRSEPGPMNDTGSFANSQGWLDAVLAVLLFAATVGYLSALPLQLEHADEAHYLHEAKRVLGGEKLYRDIFELTTPGWIYLMAFLFRIFGVTLATARCAAAVIQGGTTVLLFAVCRRLGVRRGLSLASAAIYVAVSHSVWPVASQHWLVTLATVALLLLCLRPLETWRSVVAGLLVGVITSVHQTRGLAIGAGVGLFLIIDIIQPWAGDRRDLSAAPWKYGIAYLLGVLLILVPMLVGLLASTGFQPVWQALVVHPLQNYHGVYGCPWGQPGAGWFIDQALKYAPLALLCTLPRLIGLWRSDGDPNSARAGTFLIVVGAFSILSIWYYPDFIHIAFLAPVFLAALADGLERALRAVPRRIGTVIGWTAAVAILVATGAQLRTDMAKGSASGTVRYQSAFGPVDVAPSARAFYEQLTELVGAAPSRTLYCHPRSSYTYLLVDARNPTRFEFLLPESYNTPAQAEEVLQVLRTQSVPYVMLTPRPRVSDPIADFVHQHYERVSDRGPGGVLWRRGSSNGQNTAAREP